MTYQHKGLANGRWAELTLAEQMLNIGSEVSRAINWKSRNNEEHCRKSVYRALELVELTIEAQRTKHNLKEFTRLKEIIMDYFLGSNQYNSSPNILKQFTIFARANG